MLTLKHLAMCKVRGWYLISILIAHKNHLRVVNLYTLYTNLLHLYFFFTLQKLSYSVYIFTFLSTGDHVMSHEIASAVVVLSVHL